MACLLKPGLIRFKENRKLRTRKCAFALMMTNAVNSPKLNRQCKPYE